MYKRQVHLLAVDLADDVERVLCGHGFLLLGYAPIVGRIVLRPQPPRSGAVPSSGREESDGGVVPDSMDGVRFATVSRHGRLPEWPKGAVCKTVG